MQNSAARSTARPIVTLQHSPGQSRTTSVSGWRLHGHLTLLVFGGFFFWKAKGVDGGRIANRRMSNQPINVSTGIMNHFTNICVYCGSAKGTRPEYETAAQEMGAELVRRGLGLVYGGGSVGLMGVLARTVDASGGTVTGILPQALAPRELSGHPVGTLEIVDTMHTRKARMADLADAFVAMPGGYGTLEELFEVLTWAQIGYHRKPIGLLNVAGFYDPLLAMIDHGIGEGFIRPSFRDLLVSAQNATDLMDRLSGHEMPMSVLAGREE